MAPVNADRGNRTAIEGSVEQLNSIARWPPIPGLQHHLRTVSPLIREPILLSSFLDRVLAAVNIR